MQYNITYRQKDKGWQYIISYKDAKGLWKQKSKQGFDMKKTAKKAAEERLEQLKKEVETAIRVEPQYRGITFGDFAKELIEHEKLHKAHNTNLARQIAVNKFEGIKNKALAEVKYSDLQRCADKLVKDGLSLSTVKHYLVLISYIFNQAVSPYELIPISPVTNIKLPTMEYIDSERKKVKALNKNEIELFLNELKKVCDLKYYYLCSLALATGLREGELLGLTWDDVDFSKSEIHVRKQWKKIDANKYGFGVLKKKNSRRTIPISLNTKKLLMEYREHFNAVGLDNRVFALQNYNVIFNVLKASKGININVTMHMLRHTYATNLIANGMDFKTAAALLGHDAEMTMRTYSHVTDDMMQAAAKKINAIF